MPNIYKINLPGIDTLYDVGKNQVRLTQAQYDALTETEKNDPNTFYYITDASTVGVDSIGELSDVNISNPQEGHALLYDSTNHSWVNEEITITSQLSELEDVNVNNVTDGQVIKYDASTNKWINGEAGSDINLSVVNGKVCITYDNGE